MPIWSEILVELQQTSREQGGIVDFDGVRRKYLQKLYEYTGRNIILYASGWLQKSQTWRQFCRLHQRDAAAQHAGTGADAASAEHRLTNTTAHRQTWRPC